MMKLENFNLSHVPVYIMSQEQLSMYATYMLSLIHIFEDINYQLAQNEDKTAIFENWCDFLNYFDSSIFVQLSFINQDVYKRQSADSAAASSGLSKSTI